LCERCQSKKAKEENIRFAKARKECYAVEHETCNFDAPNTVGLNRAERRQSALRPL
jgi:methylphosphotriester-DNA--protein-cysteine methyltransferase